MSFSVFSGGYMRIYDRMFGFFQVRKFTMVKKFLTFIIGIFRIV